MRYDTIRALMNSGLTAKDVSSVQRIRSKARMDEGWTPPVVALGEDGVAEIKIYDGIGYDWWSDSGVTHSDFVDQLEALGDVPQIRVRINSPGGDVFDGLAIYNVLRSHEATVNVEIEGFAASIASVIAMAGNTVTMHDAAMFMIHDAWSGLVGNSQDMMEMAMILDKIDGQIANTYAARGKNKPEYYREAMDKETWYSAEEAVNAGLADKIYGQATDDDRTEARAKYTAELARCRRLRRNRGT